MLHRSIVGLLLLAGSLSACKKEKLTLYSEPASVYFSWPDGVSQDEPVDSLATTFSWSGESVHDTLVKIPVAVTGSPSTQDRTFSMVAGQGSTAVAGTHYEALPDSFVIHAGQVSDTVAIRFYRTADMQANAFLLILQLLPNEHFSTDIQVGSNDTYYNTDTVRTFNTTRFKLTIDDVLSSPLGWDEYYYGPFSQKKVHLMLDVLDVPATFFTTLDYLLSSGPYYAVLFERYLKNQKAAGNTIYEDDGTEMTMGDYTL